MTAETTHRTAESRIDLIQASIRCYVHSLVGLIPVIGIPWAIAAMIQSAKTKRQAGGDWNPAARYLAAARWLGPAGILSTAAFLLVVGALRPEIGGMGGPCFTGPS